MFSDATYTIDRVDSHSATTDGDQSTFHDVTDIFDDSVEPTLCIGAAENGEDVPDLPRDSRNVTPSQSTPNSRESTPKALRKAQGSNSGVNESTAPESKSNSSGTLNCIKQLFSSLLDDEILPTKIKHIELLLSNQLTL